VRSDIETISETDIDQILTHQEVDEGRTEPVSLSTEGPGLSLDHRSVAKPVRSSPGSNLIEAAEALLLAETNEEMETALSSEGSCEDPTIQGADISKQTNDSIGQTSKDTVNLIGRPSVFDTRSSTKGVLPSASVVLKPAIHLSRCSETTPTPKRISLPKHVSLLGGVQFSTAGNSTINLPQAAGASADVEQTHSDPGRSMQSRRDRKSGRDSSSQPTTGRPSTSAASEPTTTEPQRQPITVR